MNSLEYLTVHSSQPSLVVGVLTLDVSVSQYSKAVFYFPGFLKVDQ